MKVYFCLILLLFLPSIITAQTFSLSENDKAQIIKAIFKGYDSGYDNNATGKSKVVINLRAEHILPEMLSGIKKVDVVLISEKDIDAMVTNGGQYYYLSEFEVGEESSVNVTVGNIRIGKGTGKGVGLSWQYQCRKVAGKWKVRQESGGVPFHLFF